MNQCHHNNNGTFFQRKVLYHCGWESLRLCEGITPSPKISSIHGKYSFHAKLYHDIRIKIKLYIFYFLIIYSIFVQIFWENN